MPELRSRTVTHGRNMAGARALMRASGVAREDFGKPIIAVANCFTEFVPGHTHLQPVGRIVSEAITAAGGIPREFNTIAVDDGIAMGHGGMLYSLPSRDLIADSRRVHGRGALRRRADLHLQLRQDHPGHADGRAAAEHPDRLRLRRPDGGRHGHARRRHGPQARPDQRDRPTPSTTTSPTRTSLRIEENACPTCGSCSGMFTANSMNCLTEAIGLALPGNGSVLATHTARKALYEDAGPHGRRDHQALLRAGRRHRPAAHHRHPRRLRERHGPRHRHGRLHQHDPAPAGRRPGGRARLRP